MYKSYKLLKLNTLSLPVVRSALSYPKQLVELLTVIIIYITVFTITLRENKVTTYTTGKKHRFVSITYAVVD